LKIQLKRSNVLDGGAAKEPTSAQMEFGELAVNYNTADPAIFLKDEAGNIIRVAGIGNISDDGQVELPSTSNPPANPLPGNLWFNADDGRLYIYYNDGNTAQWVDASPDSDGSQVYTFTGGEPRTLKDKLEEVVSVLDFIPEDEHADIISGTSTYDCTADIQTAFDWWAGASRRSLTFPTGEYNCTAAISAVQNMTENLLGNSLIGLGGRLKFTFATTGVDASRFGLVLNLDTQGKLMRQLHISGLSISGNYDEYAMILDGGYSTSGAFLYGFVLERLYTSNRGLCVSGNTFECVIKECYISSTQGDGNDPAVTYVPTVPSLLVTQADVIGGTGGSGGASRKISSMTIDSNNIRGGLNGISITDGSGDVTLRNNTTLTSWQHGLYYNGTFSGCNILHHHAENCWQQYSDSTWGDPTGRGFFDHDGKRWSGTSGDGSGDGSIGDPYKGDWAQWYNAASSIERNSVLQRSGISVVESGGAGNLLGCRQVADSNGGTMSAIRVFTSTLKPTFISGTNATGMGTEVCVSGSGSVFLNTDSYKITGNWPKIIQATGATTRPMLQSVAHGTGNNTNSQYTPFSQSYQSSLRGSVFVALKSGVTINAPSNDYVPSYGDELHFVLQQTSETAATVVFDSIYVTNGFVAKTGTGALSSISFRYIKDNNGDNKWMITSSSP